MNPSNLRTWIALALLLLALGTVGKVYLNATAELKQGEEAFAQKDYSLAVTHYERSIQWFLPITDIQDKAADGLWKTASHFDRVGETQNAIDAYRLLRSAFYSTRSFYTPGRNWIDRCNEKIADLSARLSSSALGDKNQTYEERKSNALSVLNKPKPPNTAWAFLGVSGFWGWISCAVLFILRGMTKSGSLRPRPAVFWGTGFIIFYSLWVLGLSNA